MAKHNVALLNGQVVQQPRFIKDAGGKIIRAMGPIGVIRGVRDFGNNVDNIKHDAPVIMTSNPELIKVMLTWEVGDMVEIKGSITTKDITKSCTCKHCGQKNMKKGSLVYVNPIFICVHEKRLSPEEGIKILRSRCEISNHVTLIGAVCREPQLYVTDKGLAITTYQMAVRRKFRIATDSAEIKTDFPWIKSYGNIAKNDANAIKKGAYVFIDGMIQTRELERLQVCEHCGKEYRWCDFAMEIVPFATEYLRDYYTKEEIQAREKEQTHAATQQVFNENAIDENRPTDAPDYVEPDEPEEKAQNTNGDNVSDAFFD